MAQGQVTHTALCGVEIEIILSSKDGTFFEGTLFFYPAMILCFNHLNQPIWNPTPLIYWAFLMVIKYLHCQRPFPHHHESCTLEHSGALIVQKGTLTFIVKIIKDAFVSLFLIGGVGRDVGDRGGVWSQQAGFLAEWGLKTAVLSPVSRIRLDKDTPPPLVAAGSQEAHRLGLKCSLPHLLTAPCSLAWGWACPKEEMIFLCIKTL